MSYSLTVHQLNQQFQVQQNYQILNGILSSLEYETILVKHHQNFYDQTLSYFIVIEGKLTEKGTNKQLRIRRVFPSNSQKNKQAQNDNPENSKLANIEIECTITQNEHIDFSRVIAGNFIHQNAIIILKDPFKLYFLTKKSQSPIKLILEQSCNLTNIVSSFSFESNEEEKKKQPYYLTVYGLDTQTQANKMLNINLMTFDIKEIAQSKDYSPKPRHHHFSMFHDDRFYVFGGQILGKKEEQQLLWSFDTEKGYWFALEMKYDSQYQQFENYKAVVYDSGKIIILRDGTFYLLEIYQCKIWKLDIEEGTDIKTLIENNQIKGMVNLQKQIYLYTKNSVLPIHLALQKTPKNAQKHQSKKQI